MKLFTSESVTEGHPDKVCDQIADSILDAILDKDKNARVACEVTAYEGNVQVLGEVTTSAKVDIEQCVRNTIFKIGYVDKELGFSYDTVNVNIHLNKQSPDIAQGVNCSHEYKNSNDYYDTLGAGDQGMMFGYATNETEEYMPLAIMLSHKLTARLAELRHNGVLPYLRPDGKAQVTVEYDDKGNPIRVHTVLISTQHEDGIDMSVIQKDLEKYVIDECIPSRFLPARPSIYINPTGRFVIGGPKGDSGLTGRKIIVDTYGGYCPHGGGSFSGKDPTKVDRSATYMARYICKNLVAAGVADRLQLEVAYAIGKARPVSLYVDSFGTGRLSDGEIVALIERLFDLRPQAIIDKLGLQAPIYAVTAANGHFGHFDFPWERLDMVSVIKDELK